MSGTQSHIPPDSLRGFLLARWFFHRRVAVAHPKSPWAQLVFREGDEKGGAEARERMFKAWGNDGEMMWIISRLNRATKRAQPSSSLCLRGTEAALFLLKHVVPRRFWHILTLFQICSHFLETDVVHGNLVLPLPEEFVVRSNCLVQMGESVATKARTEKPRKPFSGCQKKTTRKMEIKWTRCLHIYNHIHI